MGSGTEVGQADSNHTIFGLGRRLPPPSSSAGQQAAGFTLIELLVVLLIAAIILGLGSPSFSDFRRNSRLTSAANDLLVAGQLARTEAIKRQTSVSICASGSPKDSEPACGGASFSGYITFVDLDGDCARSAGEKVLRVDGPLDRTVIANSNGSCLSFGANGFSRLVASSPEASHIVFCDPEWGTSVQGGNGNLSAARGVLVSKTGRMEIVRDKARIDEWDIACVR
jgi:type IV fimbrial biogenesis protein FimT